jgi:pimeloyl-ACP methyl ester carboxylesterase
MADRSRLSRRIKATALLAVVASASCASVVRERDLFHPQPTILARAPEHTRAVAVPRDGQAALSGWFIEIDAAAPTVLYLGGNGETVAASWSRLRWLSQVLRVNVLAVDYRGYGASSGAPGLRTCAEDAAALIDWLHGCAGYEHARLIVYGRSIGGGMAVYAAAHRSVHGLVLEAPPASCPEVIRSWNGQLGWFARTLVTLEPDPALAESDLQPIAMIAQVRCPLLIIHGDADTVIPQSQGRALFDAATMVEKRFLPLEGVNHNDIALNAEPVSGALARFIAGIAGRGD